MAIFEIFLDKLHLRASYAIQRRSFVYKNMVKCFSDKENAFFTFFDVVSLPFFVTFFSLNRFVFTTLISVFILI